MPNVEVIPNAQMTNRGRYLSDGVFGKSDFVIISSFVIRILSFAGDKRAGVRV